MNENEPAKSGRPRSEAARAAVLHAADDLVVELGYAAVTMKAIAERAGVSRMTVYRWWSTKAEVLFEASVHDARAELAVEPSGDELHDLTAFLAGLIGFLSRSDAGIAYRALIGEAQHDEAVAALVGTADVLGDAARAVLSAYRTRESSYAAAAQVVGPVFFWIMTGRDPAALDADTLARTFLAGGKASGANR